MSITLKNYCDNDAIEITKFLLKKGVPQIQIAMIVKKSQSWVSRIKREMDMIALAKEEGRQEMQNTIINNFVSEFARGMVQSDNALLCLNNTANTPPFQFIKAPNSAISRW